MGDDSTYGKWLDRNFREMYKEHTADDEIEFTKKHDPDRWDDGLPDDIVEQWEHLASLSWKPADTNTIKVQIRAGQNFDYGDIVSMGTDGKAYNMSDVLGVAVEDKPKKKRRKNMFRKKEVEDTTYDRPQDTDIYEKLDYLNKEKRELEQAISRVGADVTDLKADVHELCYPMGFIKFNNDINWIKYVYVYANKRYDIFDMGLNNITGYRKQGDYIQIRWIKITNERKNEDGNIVGDFNTCTNTYLLKDELIPLENCTVEFDVDFIEVKGE